MLLYPCGVTSVGQAQFLVQELTAMSVEFITDPARVSSLSHLTRRKVNTHLDSSIFLTSDWVKPGHVMQLWPIRGFCWGCGVCFWEMFLYFSKRLRRRGSPLPPDIFLTMCVAWILQPLFYDYMGKMSTC